MTETAVDDWNWPAIIGSPTFIFLVQAKFWGTASVMLFRTQTQTQIQIANEDIGSAAGGES